MDRLADVAGGAHAVLGAVAWVVEAGAALGRRGLEPSAPAKFGLALLQVGAGFLVFVWGATAFAVGPEGQTAVIFVFLLYLLHTTGELCLSPVGLSAMIGRIKRQAAMLQT